MPNTPIYGLPFEQFPPDQPGTTLYGGTSGTEPILAEAVEAELERVDGEIDAAEDRLTEVETRLDLLEAGTTLPGWTPIQNGISGSVANFDVDLTDGGRFGVGEFALVRVHMRFDLSETGFVNVNINADTGGNTYITGTRALDGANPAGDFTDPPGFPITTAEQGVDVLDFGAARGSWTIGYGATVGNNNLVATLFHMDGNLAHSFQATSSRQSTSATTTAFSTHWGSLPAALAATPSLLRFFAFDLSISVITFSNAWWWVEGYRVPA